MSLIERALRQVETDQRRNKSFQRVADFFVPQQKQLFYKNKFIPVFICVIGVLVFVAFGLLPSKDNNMEKGETSQSPITKEIKLYKNTSNNPAFAQKTKFESLSNRNQFFTDDANSEKRTGSPLKKTLEKSSSYVLTESKKTNSPLEFLNKILLEDKSEIETNDSEEKIETEVVTVKPILRNKEKQTEHEKKQDKVINSSLLSTNSLNDAGLLHLEKGDFVQSRYFFEEAIKIDSDNEKILNNIGLSFYLEGNMMEAIKYLERALRINPQNAETYGNLGIIYRKSGQYYMAEKMFKKGILINPDHPEILYNFALLFEDIKQKEKSRFYFNRFLQVAPERLKVHTAKVRNYLKSTE